MVSLIAISFDLFYWLFAHHPPGIQDNPWFCDCRISKLIELSKMVDPEVVLLDCSVTCSGPESLSGILFQRAELEQCLKPSVMTSATKITSPLGSNVLLRCDATGYPTPHLLWTKADSSSVNYTMIQESPGDGVRWSILSLTGISYKDAGEYKCKAKNLAGMSEASITVTVIGVVTTTVSPHRFGKRFGAEAPITTQAATKEVLKTTICPPTPPPLATSTATTTVISLGILTGIEAVEKIPPKQVPDANKNSKTPTLANSNKKTPQVEPVKKEQMSPLNITMFSESNTAVKSLQVVIETEDRVTLTWKTLNATSNTVLAVLYSKYGEKDMLRLSTDPSKNKVTIDGLLSNTKYMACVCPKGLQPRKDQCIVFSTDGLRIDSTSQVPVLAIASAAACIVILPLIFFLLYKVLKLQNKPQSIGEEELLKETYVKFETVSLSRPQSESNGGELWTRRDTTESERLLLCSRSSMDSQQTYKSEGSRPEYFC